jgi:hypothetical protein
VRRARALLAWLILIVVVGCERDEIVSVDPGAAPGESSPTVESIVGPTAVNEWIDTVFSGFVVPASAPFVLAESGTPELMSRGLARFGFITDTVVLADTISAISEFREGRVVLTLDTARSTLAASGTTVQLRTVEQAWDLGSVTWELAVDSLGVSEPWTGGAGGSLGPVLSEVKLSEFPDSIILPLGESSDSLIASWIEDGRVNSGLALVVADSGRLVAGSAIRLRYDGVPELQPDTTVDLAVFSSGSTFIFDRASAPAESGALRLGGIEGWRSYVEIALPDTIAALGSGQRFSLRGSTVDKAELVLISRPAPPPPFGADVPFQVQVFQLADDFQMFGPKTPMGAVVSGSVTVLQPDSLEVGETIALDITGRVQRFADVPLDSTAPPLRLAVRPEIEATTIGFWEFGAAGGDPAFTPFLRIVFTPPVEFRLP